MQLYSMFDTCMMVKVEFIINFVLSLQTSTKLSKTALAKMKSEQATLPRDPHATAITLHKLFCRPKWKV